MTVSPLPDHDGPAADEMYALVYGELKRIARHQLRADAPATLTTTDLVHEAFLKLGHGPAAGWEGRAHFFGAASRAMRQVLVDLARRRRATKHGGDLRRVSLSAAGASLDVELDEIIALDAALEQLNSVDERLRRIVELRFFAGLGEEEVARILGVTPRTVERNWVKARLILLKELDAPPRPDRSR